ncbi:D-arabinono-1,4-lactone oxidase [Halovivax cerinus]|uniref:D-arabinono-1,4-lactone oxidase n=1 Tax=Halovivax cerinus TaxID=1487865 RepID=A0ABD5NL37_9EURY|nr:D-arabinono-1,4-lactone oxidase [Halovivax cerinus]
MTGSDRDPDEATMGSSGDPGRWRNWSGSVFCRPDRVVRPKTVDAIRALVERHAGERSIRVAGSGHSFSAVVPTDDVLVSLERFTGVRSVEYDRRRVTVRAGTRLAELSETLSVHGLAMTNLGDVDRQTVAGALATGTHGTGIDLGILPTQIAEIELVTADGEIRTLSVDDGDTFRAAQLSLGTLGIVTAVTLDVEPAYRLRERTWTAPLETALEDIGTIRDRHRHVELFWFPHVDVALVKILEKTDEPTTSSPVPAGVAEGATNLAWGAVCRLSSRLPRLSPSLARLAGGALSGGETVGPSHEVFASSREVRFNEAEFAVPAADGPAVLRQLRQRVLPSHPEIVFPIEFRYVAGDDILLSPATGRDAAYVAVHAYHRKPFRSYFEACESVFDAFDGRPHWGKWYSLDRARLRERYPEWDTFESVRRRFDPEGTFLNDQLSALFDPA